jgi:hypothetical protein
MTRYRQPKTLGRLNDSEWDLFKRAARKAKLSHLEFFRKYLLPVIRIYLNESHVDYEPQQRKPWTPRPPGENRQSELPAGPGES